MKYAYIEKRFTSSSMRMIEQANGIIEAYRAQGYRLTLRQLYYQMVKANLIPNWMKSYKRLASIINDARWAGYVDWAAIEDRARNTVEVSTWENPAQIVRAAIDSYREDLWKTQPVHLEVMCEKDAVSNIVTPVCRSFGVPFTANRGYPSASLLYEVDGRFHKAAAENKDIHIIYLGDHDPSGLDMDRDILERLSLFSESSYDPEVERIALTYEQVEDWRLPPNPAKLSDSRASGYVSEFGSSSWELDAIEAAELSRIVREKIKQVIDEELWEEAEAEQENNKARLERALEELEGLE